MKSNKTSIVLTLIAALAVTAAAIGCKEKSDASTEMDKAGQDVKDAASKTADAAKDAAVATKDAVTNAVGK